LISVIRAAVGEEFFFRGYSISRLREISGSEPVAVFLSWAIFTVEHVGIWGWGHLLIAGFGGAALTFLFVWRKNLWVSIIAHAIIDGFAVLS
jgi:membrane protease YdiL (CAAX protease family)